MTRILIVEDEAIVAADLASKLRQMDYDVTAIAGTGEEAVALARQHRPDVVLMDIQLAGAMDGITAADQIRRELDLPVIFLTAHSDGPTIDRAKLTESFGYILKPFEERELRTLIEMALYKHAAERRLRESQRDLNRAQAVAHVGSWRLDVQRNQLTWSDETWRMFGLTPGTPLTYETFLASVHPGDREFVDRHWQAALAGQPYEVEHRILVQGQVKWVREQAELEQDAGGRLLGGFGTVQDITERKHAGQALAESQQRLTQAMAIGRCFAFEWNPVTDEVIRARECEPILGLTGDRAVRDTGRDFFQRIEPADRPQFEALTRGLSPDHRAYRTIYRVRRPDGEIVILEEAAQAHFDAQGHFFRLVGISFDVTERERVQQARETHLARLNQLITVAEEVLAETSMPALMQRVVDAAEELVGADGGICGHGYHDGVFEVGASSRKPGRFPCPPGRSFRVERGGVYLELMHDKPTLRYTQEELLRHPAWWGLPKGHAPLNGLLGARLVDRQGRATGLVMVTHKQTGEFTAEDEVLLAQLAAQASLGMQHLHARQEAEQRAQELSTVFEAMAEVVIISDRTGRAIQANPAAVQLCGFNPAAATPAQFIDRMNLRHPDGRRLRVPELPCQQALQGQPVRNQRLRLVTAGGDEMIVLASSSPLGLGPDLIGSVCVWHDVSERERLLAELEQRVAERTADLQHSLQQLQQEMNTRVVAETALRESEERYRTLFKVAPVGILITDVHGRIHGANEAACTMLGASSDQLRTVPARHFYTTPRQRRQLLAEVRRTGRGENRELNLQKADGSRFIGAILMSRIELRGEQRLLSVLQDLTQQQRAERHNQGIARLLELFATKASRKEYLEAVVRLLQEWCACHGVGIRLLSADRYLPYTASKGFSRRFLQQENFMCLDDHDCACLRTLQGLARPEDRECVNANGSFFCSHMSKFLDQYPKVARRSPPVPCLEARYESIAHVPIRFHDQVQGSIHLTDRRPHHFTPDFVAFIEAIGPLVGEALHRFQVEEELRESEQRFRSMIENHDAVMLLINPATHAIEDANPAAARFYGYARAQLCGMKTEDLNVRSGDMALGDHAAFSRKHHHFLTFPQRLASGETRLVEIHSSPVKIGGRDLLFCIIYDITERKRLEQRILEVSDDERQRIGQDLHDSLGGNLTGIALLSQGLSLSLARESPLNSSVAREIVQAANQAVAQSRSIARGLCPVGLGRYGLTSGLQEYAADVARLFRVKCHCEVRGEVLVPDEFVASHLFRIVQEAVNNAIRHGEASRIGIQLTREEAGLCLRIRDNGSGFERNPEHIRGMGLRTMQYRADVIGAFLEISSVPGKGSVVTCRIENRFLHRSQPSSTGKPARVTRRPRQPAAPKMRRPRKPPTTRKPRPH